MKCNYCQEAALLITGERLFPHIPHLAYKKFWRCEPCKAHVGCHGHTDKPLGKLANAGLRRARMEAHQAFDPLWKKGFMKRKEAYAWLSNKLALPIHRTHIAQFGMAQCFEVVEAVKSEWSHADGP